MKNFNFKINDHAYTVDILGIDNNMATVDVNGILYEVEVEQKLKPLKRILPRQDFVPFVDSLPCIKAYKSETATGLIRSPLPGQVINIMVKVGDAVRTGQTVVCIEAMKMENNIRTHRDGIVKAVHIKTNDVVVEGGLLLEIE